MTQSAKRIVRNRSNPRRRGQKASPFPQSVLGPSNLPLLRTSERGTFKWCRWKWWMEYHELYKPSIDVPPLRFGSLVHSALAAYYKPGIRRGPHPAETFQRLYERDLVETAALYDKAELESIWHEAADLGVVMLERYIDHYGKDDEWKVLVTEYPFRTIVKRPLTGAPWFWYVGILDGCWESRSTKRRVLPEHKTTKSIQLNYLRMDDQSTAYWTFGVDALINAALIAPNGSQTIDGVLFNFLRKGKRDEREQDADGFYLNKDGSVSKKQPAPYHARVPVYRDWYEREGAKLRVLEEFEDIEDVRRGHRGHYKNPSQFTCGGCWALDICELHEIGQDWIELRNLTTRKWEPYAAHEIAEGR